MNRPTISESIQYQPAPTINSVQYFEESSSMLSLSNYLQQEDSGLCLKNNQKPIRNCQEIEKQKIFNEIHSAQRLFMRHLATDFNQEQNSYQSESMLLTYSSIKENKFSVLEKSQGAAENQKSTQFEEKRQKQDFEPQSSPSRIRPKTNQQERMIYTDSVELLELLAIPKDSSPQKCQQILIKNTTNCLTEEMQKLKEIYQIFRSNEDLFKKMKIFQSQNDSKKGRCFECQNALKKIQILSGKLEQKQKEIKKYETLIEKLNSTIFDLKIENKQLLFENKQFNSQIEKLLQQKSEAKRIQRFKTVSCDYEQENSLDEILKESNGVINSFTNLSRKTTKICENNYKKNINSQSIDQTQHSCLPYDKKIYPLTPMPSYSHLKKSKSQQKLSNFSDKKLEISISQVRQPTIYQLTDAKASKILKEHNQSPTHLSDKKSKCVHKSQKNVMRFSDISKESNDSYIVSQRIQSDKKSSHHPLSQKSPIKAHGFLKVKTKTKNIQQNIENLKNHPLNKISQEDNNSQTSQTKTQKFYGFRKSSKKEKVHQSNDGKNLNVDRVNTSQKKLPNRQASHTAKIHENASKNSIIYKSFKQIGSLHENDHLKSENTSLKNQTYARQSEIEYGTKFYHQEENDMYGTSRNLEECQRNYLSPCFNCLNSKYQNCGRSLENCHPQTKLSPRHLPIKSFLR